MRDDDMQATIVIGKRHDKPEANGGQGCFCGCSAVVGLTGSIVRDSDTPKLASVEPALCIAEFTDVPYHCGPMLIAYSYAELGLSVPTFEREERHEAVRLFEPAPAQMPGQLGLSDGV